MPEVEEFVVAGTPSFLVVSVETLVECFPGRRPVPHATGSPSFVRANCQLRRPRGREEKEGVHAAICFVPGGSCRRSRRRARRACITVQDWKQLRNVENYTLSKG